MIRNRMPERPLPSHGGFTLVEMMVVIALIGIITMLAAPSFNDAILRNKLTSYTNSFMASAQLARSEAIKRNALVRICRSANGTSCASTGTFQQGWIVFHDADKDGAVTSGDTIIRVQQAISSDYHFTSEASDPSEEPYNLKFLGSGVGATGATVTLCRATPLGEQERAIRIEGVGRASVSTTRNGTCP